MTTFNKNKLIFLSLIISTTLIQFHASTGVSGTIVHEHVHSIDNEIDDSPSTNGKVDPPVPIVLWHGMGDTCCSPLSLGKIIKLLESQLQTYVTSLQFGSSTKGDFSSGYFGSVNEQVEHACDLIRNNDKLTNGYHAIGFSQGGQFLRAVAQRCPHPPMKSLISLGGQHQGVYGLPRCPGKSSICSMVRSLLAMGAYTSFVQSRSIQAQYWHDSKNINNYIQYSQFLADINNEKNPPNTSYKNNLSQLKYLVLVMFGQDTMVVPRESSLFTFYADGANGTSTIVPLKESKIYTEDRIGLKTLDETGRLITYTVPGDHLQLDMSWFKSEIINKYLK